MVRTSATGQTDGRCGLTDHGRDREREAMTRRVSFQRLLLVTLLAVSLGALGLASVMTFGVHRRAVTRLSNVLTQQTLERVADRLDELVGMAVEHAELFPQLAPDGRLTSAEFPQVFEQLWATVAPHAELSYIGVGLAETGEYAMVRHESGTPLEVRMYVRDPETGPQIRDYAPTAAGLQPVRTLPWTRDGDDPRTSYELRLRPFYLQAARAKTSVWTDSYEFWGGTARGKVPGVTFATPVYDADGHLSLVWDIDLELASLSRFLTRVQGLVTGRLLIVEHRQDGTWNVIAEAQSDPDDPWHHGSQPAVEAYLRRLPVQFADAVGRGPSSEPVSVRGETWRVASAPLRGDRRPEWLIVSLNPMELEQRTATFGDKEFLMAALMTGALAVVAAWAVSQSIAAPLLTLDRNARRLVAGETDTIAPIAGSDEIGRLATTLNELTQKVHERQSRLEDANLELQRSRQRLLGHFEHTPVAAMELDERGHILRWNAAAECIFGWTAAEVLGKRFDFIVPEAIRSAIDEVWNRLLARTGGFRNDNQNVTKDGRTIDCEWYNTPFLDEHGRVYGIACLVLDVTERTRADEEIRRLNADLERRVAERTAELSRALKELETFSYTVAHDLRSPLRSIAGFSQALQEDCGTWLRSAGVDHLDRIRAATQRMSDLIDALLTLARVSRHELKREPVDLSELVEQELVRYRQLEPQRDVYTTVAPGLVVSGDRGLLRIAIHNLVDNAWKFSRHASPARIEFGTSPGPDGREFFLRDNGVGFDPAHAAHLFQPFQRLHRVDEFEGHGVGLATVHRILDRHGGHIRLDSHPGAGTTCYFTSPTSPGIDRPPL
jgi:PAS domain S-box-containing protein